MGINQKIRANEAQRSSFYSDSFSELAIIVPTLNERENIIRFVEALEAALRGIQWEVLFVDDHSPDGTAEEIRSIGVTNRRVRLLERFGRRGLSSACIEGMRLTVAPYLAIMDADLQHDEHLLPEMLRKLKTESLDLVVGSRTVPGGSMGDIAGARLFLSHLGSKAASLLRNCELSDAMSGFFMVNRSFFERCFHHLEGIGFKVLLELLAASKTPPRMAEIPYTFRRRLRGSSKFGMISGLAYLQFLAKELARFSPASVPRMEERTSWGVLHRRS